MLQSVYMDFATSYQKLNTEQKKAVETIDGPVMVIAGPGTGKTQVLALRIAHILNSTDTPPDGILCLTFTNAGVKAMRERLLTLIGPTATRVKITTFHAYGLELIEEYYDVLGFDTVPTLLDDAATVALFQEVLFAREWDYVRPRNNPTLFYNDLKSLISTLKRDGISPSDFKQATLDDIERIKHDPESISRRGASKGELKKDAEKSIESLTRTLEAADFYAQYEDTKKARGAIDYNDVLSLMVRVAHESEDAVAAIRERFLYVLIDEHQDSSGVQNAFLEAVWKEVEQPNLFVVGDDRQLIYGFGGASLAYFESFKHTFGKATLITLTHNYRSTQTILDSAEALLQSSLATGKLVGSDAYTHPLTLVACEYPRDEIVAAGTSFRQAIAEGVDANQCALLVPKNRHVKTAVTILQDMGLSVAAGASLGLLEVPETHTLFTILRIIHNPYDVVALSQSMVDPVVGIDALVAHEYLYHADTRNLSVSMLVQSEHPSISAWGVLLASWIKEPRSVYEMIQVIGEKILLENPPNDESFRRRVEVIRTLLHLVLSQIEKKQQVSLVDFLTFIDHMIEFGEDIPLAVFGAEFGIKVLTLHGSKGLEFDHVWIAHMDERSLMSIRRGGFVLPQSIAQTEQEAQEEVAKRQLYVAITRAKYTCTISYASESNSGASQQLASIVESLPAELLQRKIFDEPADLKQYVVHTDRPEPTQPDALIDLVRAEYADRKVSVTLLNNFFECPWKWYFRSLLQLPEAMTDSIHIGNIAHKTIEYILNKKTTDRSPGAVRQYIQECAVTEALYEQDIAARYIHHVQKIVDTWMTTYYPDIVAPYDTEKNIAYRDPDFAHLSIVGKVDLVEEIITGEVRVTDWKTGSTKTATDIEKSDDAGHMSGLLRQLAMYSYLIHGQSKSSLEVTESRLVFVESKKGDKHAVHVRKITTDDTERLRSEIQEYDMLLKSGEWITQQCRAKLYGSDTECPYCARARAIYAVDTTIDN